MLCGKCLRSDTLIFLGQRNENSRQRQTNTNVLLPGCSSYAGSLDREDAGMKISEKRQMELYSSISEPITSLRVRNQLGKVDWDQELFRVQLKIWRNVHKTLNLDKPV